MSGFVYIWYDRKHKRYYVGSHWGSSNDGYVCSSTWMKQAYKRRPEDFKRRILSIVETSRKDLLLEEQRWLSMMKDEEMKGPRYYNMRKETDYLWFSDEEKRLNAIEKMRGRKFSDEHRQKLSKAKKGRTLSDEHRRKLSEAGRGRQFDDETRAKISKANTGKRYSEEISRKLSELRKGKSHSPLSEGTRAKIAASVTRYHEQKQISN